MFSMVKLMKLIRFISLHNLIHSRLSNDFLSKYYTEFMNLAIRPV